MSSIVACFCGNVYTAPPERCDVCGCSIDGADSGHPANSPRQDAGEVSEGEVIARVMLDFAAKEEDQDRLGVSSVV
jgi:hypothetical protein